MIYRRIKHGQLVEGIEIVRADVPSRPIGSADSNDSDSIRVLFCEMEGETLFYDVELPKQFQVKPPDLRRFAYDHKKVESLVVDCINDNAYRYVSEPQNESLLEKIEQELYVVLQDLNSVIDLLSVGCDLATADSHNDISVRVEFEHKNGEHRCVIVNINLEMA